MASKQFSLSAQRTVTISKRKGSRSLRLSITPDGRVRVTMPTWLPYAAGLEFAKTREQWIAQQMPARHVLTDGAAIGKAHHLHLLPGKVNAVRTRLSGNQIWVRYPEAPGPEDPAVQAAAHKACVRALRRQAEQLLPQRLAVLAAQHGYAYRSVRVKELKSRWGSCDSQQNIVLNLYLMQLPWDCIDYVLLHELTHTTIMRHGPDFWGAMQGVLPAVKTLRKTMRGYQPTIFVASP